MCVNVLLYNIIPSNRNESKHFPRRGNNVKFLKYLSPKTLFFISGHNSTDALVDVKYSFIGNGISLQHSV